MNIKRAVMIAVLAVAVAALAVPLIGFNAKAAGSAANAKALATAPKANAAPVTRAASPKVDAGVAGKQEANDGKVSAETLNALGIRRLPKGVTSQDVAQILSKKISHGNPDLQVNIALPPGTGPGGSSPIRANTPKTVGGGGPLIGQPLVLNEVSALCAALITNIGGRDNQFSEVALIADWDGREDCAADRGTKVDDFSFVEPEIDFSLTRAAISEHTFANGHLFNSYYYGDTIGNVYFGFDLVGSPLVDAVFVANIPAIINGGAAGAGGFRITDDTRGAG